MSVTQGADLAIVPYSDARTLCQKRAEIKLLCLVSQTRLKA